MPTQTRPVGTGPTPHSNRAPHPAKQFAMIDFVDSHATVPTQVGPVPTGRPHGNHWFESANLETLNLELLSSPLASGKGQAQTRPVGTGPTPHSNRAPHPCQAIRHDRPSWISAQPALRLIPTDPRILAKQCDVIGFVDFCATVLTQVGPVPTGRLAATIGSNLQISKP